MMATIDTLAVAALVFLGVVFVAAFVGLMLVCYRRYRYSKSPPHEKLNSVGISKPDPRSLLPCTNSSSVENSPDLQLEDVRLAPQIDKILKDAQWMDDATGLIPHCLAILKLCHHLTEGLVSSTLTRLPQYQLDQIIQASRRVSPRLDDVARAMYPPLDPRLLEARCSSLILTLALLASHSQVNSNSPQTSNTNRDIASDLEEMERHLQVLREAAEAHETFREILTEGVTREAAEC